MRVFSISLGCPKNRVDSERALGSLGHLTMTDSPHKADLVFINTCGFIAPAIEESVRTIIETISDTAKATSKPFIVVAGCLVGRFGAKNLAPDLPEVNLLLDASDIGSWGEQIARAMNIPFIPGRLISTGPSYAWLKVSDGCRHACAFCTIPSIRGKLRSTPKDILIAEAKHALATGVKELILVAQDLTAWGVDFASQTRLANLLDGILPLEGLERLRLMYLYPAGLNDDLLRFLQGAGQPFIPYFDIPLQHASSSILSRMGRPFAGNPTKVIDKVRSFFPEAALRTSLIVGFPGETEKDFETLTTFVQDSRFLHLGVFAYQAEEGTKAATMPDQIPDSEKEWRKDSLMDIQAEISEELLENYAGERLSVLVDAPQGEWPGLFTGRTWFQAPEIDGITYISGSNVFPGNMVEAEITEATTYDLIALADPAGEEAPKN